MPLFHRKKNRLPLAVYREPGRYFLTLSCHGRRAAFLDAFLVERCASVLSLESRKRDLDVVAYCFMPDHLHLLLTTESGGDLIAFVHDFKQKTGYDYRKRTGRALWQKSYFDRVLRSDDDTLEVARYIFENPVRARLVNCAGEYPHSGSFVYDRAIMEA